MEIQFVAGFAAIAPNVPESLKLYVDAFGLPLEGESEYKSTSKLGGVRHFGVWPLSQAAQSCFGTDQWPDDKIVPQATLEFEMSSPDAVEQGVGELIDLGYVIIHGAKQEPWGQTIARLLSPEGLLIGLSYAPWLHNG
ncbi:MAG: hypothetical protein P1P76_05280 [Anaerolineales bacterium]|nr:hypothetical protein [Anaerolineales bacterium]